MPPPSAHPAFHLSLLPRPFHVEQHMPTDTLPPRYIDLLLNSGSTGRLSFVSVTRTEEEVTIVCEVGKDAGDDERARAGWRCVKIAGPMDFGITGVMCNFSTPLKLAGIPIFAVSTWNTDYVLVPKEMSEKAVRVLKEDGWIFTG